MMLGIHTEPARAPIAIAPADDAVLHRLRAATTHGGDRDLAHRLAEVQRWLAGDVASLEAAIAGIEQDLGGPVGNGYVDRARLAARHLVARPGKRVRPLCVLIASRLGASARADDVRALAIASELAHAATLLHDDVIDEGSERRGVPTARRVFGNSASVLAGDHLLVRALRLVASTGLPEVLPRLLHVIDEMVEAESVQLVGRITPLSDRSALLRVIRGKTGTLFRWSMEAGGIAAGLLPPQVEKLAECGMKAGVAFQLVDDALDLSGDAAALGKATLADLREGKLTWPLLIASEREPALLDVLRAASAEHEPAAACRQVALAVRRTDAVQETLRTAREHADAARHALAVFGEVPARRAMELVIEAMVARIL